ncbi:hypothetical protein Dimus_007310, partial [Dionaea muscipula]
NNLHHNPRLLPITQPKLPPAEDFTDHHRDHQRGRAATSAASPSPRSSNLLTFKPHRRLSHHHLRRPTPTTDHRREDSYQAMEDQVMEDQAMEDQVMEDQAMEGRSNINTFLDSYQAMDDLPQRRPRAAMEKAATVAKIEHDSSGGDGRRRQQQEPSTVASKMYFRGQRIWSAAMEELMANGMRHASQDRGTPGGLASILHCDEFRNLFPRSTKVKCLADARLFLDAWPRPKEIFPRCSRLSSAILGMHSIVSHPMVVGGQVVPRPMMYIALTYDHRLINGREAVFFLRRIKDVVEDPRRLLLNV